ncbi:hypothetical protein V2J09_023185 [Rumex salicifolius]
MQQEHQCNTNEKLQREDGTEKGDEKVFRILVGSLNYLTHTRPDIAYCVSVYVARTINYRINHEKVEDSKLRGYTDSDWSWYVDDRKSTFGFVFSLGLGAITWSSKKQETVALSASEVEFVSNNKYIKQLLMNNNHILKYKIQITLYFP